MEVIASWFKLHPNFFATKHDHNREKGASVKKEKGGVKYSYVYLQMMQTLSALAYSAQKLGAQ